MLAAAASAQTLPDRTRPPAAGPAPQLDLPDIQKRTLSNGLAVWLVASFAAYLAMLRAILPRDETLLIAAAFPAVFINIGHGQNGFLTAALLGGALHLLDRWPWLAGLLIGVLAYKPQFGALIPIALLAGQRWNTIGAAALTVTALVALSFAMPGGHVWHAFLDSMKFAQTIVLEQGDTGWEKIQ